MHNLKCPDTNNNVNLTSMQIRSTPISTGIPSPAMLLFNRPIRSLLSKMNNKHMNINSDDTQYEVLKAYQDKYGKDSDTCKDSLYFSLGSTVTVQQEDGRTWKQRSIKEANKSDQYGRSYVGRVMKMGRLITLLCRAVCIYVH